MSDDALEAAARLLQRRVGLRLDPTIRGRLHRAVRDEAGRRSVAIAEYVRMLDGDADVLQDLVNRITVQETSFFRDPGQFEALADQVLPALRHSSVRVWSAGCANGQEPYSLAMLLAESGIEDWRIVASDISTDALGRTRQARYCERELAGLSPNRRARHFQRIPAESAHTNARGELVDWAIHPHLRDRVDVVRHNLVSDALPLPPGSCEIVLCRNVLIYFGHADVVALLDRLSSWMAEDGILLLGYSESLWQVTDRFELLHLGRAFVYRNVGRSASSTARRARRSSERTPRPVASGPEPVSPPPPAPPAREEQLPAPEPESPASPTVGELLAEGEAALDGGDTEHAVRAFRKSVYLDPDQPFAHLCLGLALEAGGDDVAARRAYAAARAALDRCENPEVEAALEGYHLDELVRLLDAKVLAG